MQQNTDTIRLFGTTEDSIVDGPGLRFVIFVQGCAHGCPGCHNPGSWPYEGGESVHIDGLAREITEKNLIDGVTLSGGEPLDQAQACVSVIRAIREKRQGQPPLSLWLYTGYLFEDIMAGDLGPVAKELIELCDVVVDGPYVESLGTYDILWRGSSNQRVIAVKDSLSSGNVVFWENQSTFPEPPPSW